MKHKRNLLLAIISLLLVLLIAAYNPAANEGASGLETKTIFVGSEQVDCVGVAPQKCLLIKENVEDDYTFFYDTIEGFEWEEGFEYELLIEVSKVENPPADSSSIRYELVEVVNKQAVAVPPTLSILDGKWSFGSMIVDGTEVRLPDGSHAFIIIDGDSVSGVSGCNNFSGTATFDRGELSFGPLAVTRKMCIENETMTFESTLLNLFENATTFSTERDTTLELSNADGTMTATFNRVMEQTLYVGSEQVDCVGVAPQKCLLVKENVDDEYTFFYSNIAGFEWEEGFEYELLIEVSKVENPPADASSLSYELLEVVSKTAVSAE